MKKHFLITFFCLIPFLAFSQKKSIDGFLDIPFGSDSATVTAALVAKGGIKDVSLNEKNTIAFTGLTLSNRTVASLFVHFVDNKAYEAYFRFADFAQSDMLDYYDSFSNDITSVYGKGKITSNFGNLSNAARIKRLQSGNASCSTVWRSNNKNSVALEFYKFNREVLITLDYQSAELQNLDTSKRTSDL